MLIKAFVKSFSVRFFFFPITLFAEECCQTDSALVVLGKGKGLPFSLPTQQELKLASLEDAASAGTARAVNVLKFPSLSVWSGVGWSVVE